MEGAGRGHKSKIKSATRHMIDAQKQTADDNEQLRRLGYEAKFDRSMSLWANFSLGFTYLSPVVGVYTLFASFDGRRRTTDVLELSPGRDWTASRFVWCFAKLFRSTR